MYERLIINFSLFSFSTAQLHIGRQRQSVSVT